MPGALITVEPARSRKTPSGTTTVRPTSSVPGRANVNPPARFAEANARARAGPSSVRPSATTPKLRSSKSGGPGST